MWINSRLSAILRSTASRRVFMTSTSAPYSNSDANTSELHPSLPGIKLMRSLIFIGLILAAATTTQAQQPFGKDFVYHKAGDREMKLYVV